MCNDASVQLRGWELSHAGLRDGERTFQDVNLRCWVFFFLSFVIFWCEGGAAPSGTAATLLDRWCWGRGGGREERVDGRQGSFSCQASAAAKLVGGGGAISQHHGCSSRIRVEFRRRPIKQLISVHFCQMLKGRNASDVLIFSSLYLCLPLFYCHALNTLRLHTFYFPCVYNHACQETLSPLGSNGHRQCSFFFPNLSFRAHTTGMVKTTQWPRADLRSVQDSVTQHDPALENDKSLASLLDSYINNTLQSCSSGSTTWRLLRQHTAMATSCISDDDDRTVKPFVTVNLP